VESDCKSELNSREEDWIQIHLPLQFGSGVSA
jgi:hypothetical protein